MGIDNRFQLWTSSTSLNPSTSLVFMRNNSLIDALLLHALQNNKNINIYIYHALVRGSCANNNRVEGAILTELDSVSNGPKCGLISCATSAALSLYAKMETPATCRHVHQCTALNAVSCTDVNVMSIFTYYSTLSSGTVCVHLNGQ